ncbi:MAG: hypothetical protein Fur0010_16300 [Bdellovibrio sp.]
MMNFIRLKIVVQRPVVTLLFSALILSGCVSSGDEFGNQYANMRENSGVSPRVQESMDRLTKNGRTFPTSGDIAREVDPTRDVCTTCAALHTDDNPRSSPAVSLNTPVCKHFNRFKSAGVPETPLKQALFFFERNKSRISHQRYISIADYSQNSTEKRFYILDLQTGEVRKEKVSHGSGHRGSERYGDINHDGMLDRCHHGNNLNDRENMTRPGFFVTRDFYRSGSHSDSWPRLDSQGNNGLRMAGLSPGVNDEALNSGVVMHGAYYNDGGGKMGRSYGCPAFTSEAAPSVHRTISGGTLYYSYTPVCRELQQRVENQIQGWEGMCR